MPRLSMNAVHRLGRDEAQRRLQEKLSVVRGRYGRQLSDLHEEWNESPLSFGFKVIGMSVTGHIEVEDTEVRLTAEVPFAVVVLRKPIERRIRMELNNLLS